MAEQRRSGLDHLGLRAAMSGRLVPVLVAAMAFVAALALGGCGAAAGLARHWLDAAGSALTVQVPQPDQPAAPPSEGTRQARVVSALLETPGIASAKALSAEEVADLLRPWLGAGADTLSAALPLPGVVQVRLEGGGPDIAALTARLALTAPGTLVQSHGVLAGRLATLAVGLLGCATLVAAVAAGVVAAMVGVATRAGLAARCEAIEIIHELGASDGYIAARFAARAAWLAGIGAAVGTLLALPVLLGVARLAAAAGLAPPWPPSLPEPLWLALALLPPALAAMGWLTAQATVRRWLRRLP